MESDAETIATSEKSYLFESFFKRINILEKKKDATESDLIVDRRKIKKKKSKLDLNVASSFSPSSSYQTVEDLDTFEHVSKEDLFKLNQ